MATPFDDLGRAIEQLSSNPEYNILNFIQDIALSLGIIVIIGILVFVGFRYIGSHFRYVKKTNRMGYYRIAIWNEPFLKGYVNKNTDFDAPDMLKRLKEGIPEMRFGVEELERLLREGLLHIYDIKLINDIEAKLKGGIDALIVSPVPLEDPDVYYEDIEGEFAFIGSASGVFRAYPRNVLCSDRSVYHLINDYFGRKKDVYVISPFIKSRTTKMELGKKPTDTLIVPSPFKKGEELYVNVVSLPEKEAIAQVAVLLPTFAKIYKELDNLKKEFKNYDKRIQSLNRESETKWNENQGLRGILHLDPLLGYKYPIAPFDKKSILGVVIFASFLGYLAVKLPENFAPLSQIPAEMLLAGFMGILFFIVMSLEKKPQQQTDIASAEYGQRM